MWKRICSANVIKVERKPATAVSKYIQRSWGDTLKSKFNSKFITPWNPFVKIQRLRTVTALCPFDPGLLDSWLNKWKVFWQLRKHPMGQITAMIFVLYSQTILFSTFFGRNHLIVMINTEFVQVAIFPEILFSIETFPWKSSLVLLYWSICTPGPSHPGKKTNSFWENVWEGIFHICWLAKDKYNAPWKAIVGNET